MPCGKKTKKKKKKKKHRAHTPITSESQRGAMGAAYSAKKGERPVSSLRGPARKMYESMTRSELKAHLEEAGGKDLPKRSHKKKTKKRRRKASKPRKR